MLHWWPFLAANSYRLSVPTIYVQNSVSFTNSFSWIIFINSLSPIFFYKFNITNSFSRINLRIRKSSKKFVRIHTTSFWFVFAKSVLCCERPVLYVMLKERQHLTLLGRKTEVQIIFEVSEKNILVKILDILFNEKLQITLKLHNLHIRFDVTHLYASFIHLITEMKPQR